MAPDTTDNDQSKMIVRELIHAYWMEMETVQNYTAHSANLIGVRGQRVASSLEDDIETELGHARQLAGRIHTLGGTVPCSFEFTPTQKTLQHIDDPTDVLAVIQGVIDAEEAAIAQYKTLIRICDGVDYATQDLCVALLRDEEEHRREFLDYLAEYNRETAMAMS